MSNLKPEQKFISLSEFKSLDESLGSFSGYVNNFGILDSHDDITIPGCFKNCLPNLIDAGFGCADHRWGIKEEIGILLNAYEDETGLFVNVEYHPDEDSQKIRQKVNNRLSKKKKVGMSIGFWTIKCEYVVGEEAVPYLKNPSQEVLQYLKKYEPIVRLIFEAKVIDASVVSIGSNKESGVTEGKSETLSREEIQAERKKLISTNDLSNAAEIAKKQQILNLKLRMISA